MSAKCQTDIKASLRPSPANDPVVPDGLVISKPTHEQQYKKNNQDVAEDADPAVTEAVAVAAEAATEAT